VTVPGDGLEVAQLAELDQYILYPDELHDISVLHR
jgi:hypothetical protein